MEIIYNNSVLLYDSVFSGKFDLCEGSMDLKIISEMLSKMKEGFVLSKNIEIHYTPIATVYNIYIYMHKKFDSIDIYSLNMVVGHARKIGLFNNSLNKFLREGLYIYGDLCCFYTHTLDLILFQLFFDIEPNTKDKVENIECTLCGLQSDINLLKNLKERDDGGFIKYKIQAVLNPLDHFDLLVLEKHSMLLKQNCVKESSQDTSVEEGFLDVFNLNVNYPRT